MPRVKKTFPCGHRGFGKYCHRCDDAKKAEAPVKTEDLAEVMMTPKEHKKKKKKKKKR